MDAILDFYLFEDCLIDKQGKPVKNPDIPYSVSKLPKSQVGKEILAKANQEKPLISKEFKDFYIANKKEIDQKCRKSAFKRQEIKKAKAEKIKPKPGFSKADEYITGISPYFLVEDGVLLDKEGNPIRQFNCEIPLIVPIEAAPMGGKILKAYTNKRIQDIEPFKNFLEENSTGVKKGLSDAQTLKDLYIQGNIGSDRKVPLPTNKSAKNSGKSGNIDNSQFDLLEDEDFESLVDFYIFDDNNRSALLVSKEGKPVKNLPSEAKIAKIPDSPLGKQITEAVEQEIEQIEDLTGFEDFFNENKAEIDGKLRETKKILKRLVTSKQNSANFMENLKKINPEVDFSKIDYFVVPNKERKLVYDRNGNLVKNIEKENYYIFEFDEDFKPLSKETTDEDFEEIEDMEDFYMFYDKESEKIKENVKKTKEEFFSFDFTNRDSDLKITNKGSVAFEDLGEMEGMEDFYMFEGDQDNQGTGENKENLKDFVLLEETVKRGERVKFEVKTEGEFVKVYCSSASGEEEVYSVKANEINRKQDFLCESKIEGDFIVFELKFKGKVVFSRQYSWVNELINKDIQGENLILREEWTSDADTATVHLIEIFTDNQGKSRKEVYKGEYSLETQGESMKVDLNETESKLKITALEGGSQVYERIFNLVTYETAIEEETIEEEDQIIYRKKEVTTSSTGEKTEKIIEERIEKKEEAQFEEVDGDSLGNEDFFNG